MEPVYMHRKKDYAPKTMGRNSSGSGMAGGTKTKRHGKNAKAVRPNFIMVMILDLAKGGKVRWEKRFV